MKVRFLRIFVGPTEAHVYYTRDGLAEECVVIPLTDTPLTREQVTMALQKNIRLMQNVTRQAGFLSTINPRECVWFDLGEAADHEPT